jgi:hypothetical protein
MSLPTMGVVARRQTSASLWDYDAEAVGQHSPFRHASTYARGDLMLARANGELFASLNKQESEPPLTDAIKRFRQEAFRTVARLRPRAVGPFP